MKHAISITKILFSRLKAVAINSFFSTSSTVCVLKRVLIVLYNLYLSSLLLKLTLTLLKMRKDILKAISILMLAYIKVSLKKRDFPCMSFI